MITRSYYESRDAAALAGERPDVVIVSPCGFGLPGAVKQAEVVVAELPRLANGKPDRLAVRALAAREVATRG